MDDYDFVAGKKRELEQDIATLVAERFEKFTRETRAMPEAIDIRMSRVQLVSSLVPEMVVAGCDIALISMLRPYLFPEKPKS